ncbi:unnamed protein product [Soboliphyme baturini]|uniref:Secreted protein n=1 Tax=Soboliphyme baturini TaxID=241478 RepID=A0A183J304_9BILA|nr:unnamed protein product [Soboliphyme baturini]
MMVRLLLPSGSFLATFCWSQLEEASRVDRHTTSKGGSRTGNVRQLHQRTIAQSIIQLKETKRLRANEPDATDGRTDGR